MNRNFNTSDSKRSRLQREIQWVLRDKYRGAESSIPKKDRKRLEKGEPVDYIIGAVPFLGATIDLSLYPLIPRPETEYWTKQVIEYIGSHTKRYRRAVVLDLCAGSGCIGVALLVAFPNLRLDFADRDSRMLTQIKINAKKNGVSDRARYIRSDVFSHINDQYDLICANPPYVSAMQRKKLPDSVKKFEPRAALYGGKDGLAVVKKIIHHVPKFLKRDGVLWMEFGSGQKRAIEKLARGVPEMTHAFLKDQYGRWRVLTMHKK